MAADLTTEKAALRLQAKEIRATLDISALSATLCRRIVALPEYASARHVLLYLAMPGEITVEALVKEEGNAAKQFYVPRCAPKRRLAIHPFVAGETPLRAGPFGIREPDPTQVPEATPNNIDLVIVPALLFSETGDRLGYGGGYYDRFLPRLNASTIRIGALPEALVFPSLPSDPWDVPLDLIVTESRILAPERCSGRLHTDSPAPGI